MTLNAAIDRALALHQGGDLAAAEAAYRDILVTVPTLADLHYLLGMACLGQGKGLAAVKSLRTAVRMKPAQGEWLYNLGAALRQQGDNAGAADAFAKAATCAETPARQAAALAEQGAVLAALGDADGAEAALRRALALVPDLADAGRNLSAVLFNRFTAPDSLERPEAARLLAEAARLAPDRPATWARLGLAHLRAERPQDALAAFDTALARAPDSLPALLGRSDALTILGQFEEAQTTARQALSLAPEDPSALVALAAAEHGMGALADAAATLRRAVAFDPGYLAATLNLGTVLRDQGDDAGAEACYQQALIIAPAAPVVHWQRAQARLMAGDLGEGWREYEWRWSMPGFGLSPTLRGLPVWNGLAPPEGGVLLVHAEQGHGDSLQFVRYVPMLRAQGIRVLLQVQPALVRLFAESMPEGVTVVPMGDPPPPDIRLRCPLMGLPLRLGTSSLAAIPADIPYLRASDERRAAWRERLAGLPGRKVGLVWAGDARSGDPRAAAVDRRRSLTLRQLTLLGTVPGISLVSLQKGSKAAQAGEAAFPIQDWGDRLGDFADTAALIAELDLVIGVDTAVIHLAGALGRPVWVLSRFDGCWRWLRNRGDSPWYPGLRLFRQTEWADWRLPIAEMVNALSLDMSERDSEVKTDFSKPIF